MEFNLMDPTNEQQIPGIMLSDDLQLGIIMHTWIFKDDSLIKLFDRTPYIGVCIVCKTLWRRSNKQFLHYFMPFYQYILENNALNRCRSYFGLAESHLY
jgi:hypothetical protein